MKRHGWFAAAAVTACLAVAGCGSMNPPCDTDLADVDAARSAAKTSEAELAALQKERDALAAQISQQEKKRAELERRKKELEAKIAELGG